MVACIGVAAVAAQARADSAGCAAVVVTSSDPLSDEWERAVADLRAQLARSTGCAAGTIAIARASRGVALVLTTADGRATRRLVASPDALVAIGLGLVAAIPVESAVTPSASASTASPPAATGSSSADRIELPPPDAPPRRPPLAPSSPRFALGVGLGARLGEPTRVAMGELEARADVIIGDGWLVAASARAAIGTRVAGAAVEGYGYTEYGFALGAGRRLRVGRGAIDLTLSPTLVLVDEEGGRSGVPGDTASGGLTYVRVEAAGRYLFARSEGWRFGVTIGADAAPTMLGAAPRLDVPLPALPTWTLFARATAVGELP